MHYFKIQKLEFKQLVDDMTTFSSIILLNIRCNLNLTSLSLSIYIYIYIYIYKRDTHVLCGL